MIFLTRFLIFLANLYILFYVYQLHLNKCECSDNFKRDYIFYYSIVYIFVTISLILFPEFFSENVKLTNSIKLILGIALLYNIYCLYTYSKELDDNKCRCSYGFGKDLMMVFSGFYIVLLVVIFIFICGLYINSDGINGNLKNKNLNNNLESITIIRKINKKNMK